MLVFEKPKHFIIYKLSYFIHCMTKETKAQDEWNYFILQNNEVFKPFQNLITQKSWIRTTN